MTPAVLCRSNLLFFGSVPFSVEHITVIVASYNNDMISKFHITFLTLSHKESNLELLDVETVDSQTL